jgi:predicted transposase YbfD/YdcC
VNAGHGRIEVRTAVACDLLASWLRAKGFVGAAQVIRVERTRTVKGEKSVSVEYYLSSLARHEATAFDLLTWIRAHWGIENGLHYVRDETLGEDRCRVRKGGSAQVLAALRNAALHLIHDAGESNRKAATERFQVHPEEAIDLLHRRQCET